MNNILLLASKSPARKQLLSDARIPFVQIEQYADEAECDWGLPLEQLVESIARHKMEHVVIPPAEDGDARFVLTADTLGQDLKGNVFGKPTSREHAVAMIKTLRTGARVASAFCLDRKRLRFGQWQTEERILKTVVAHCVVDVNDAMLDDYLEQTDAMNTAGALTIEGYSAQFVRSVDGSYSAILGLPLFELNQALNQLFFFAE